MTPDEIVRAAIDGVIGYLREDAGWGPFPPRVGVNYVLIADQVRRDKDRIIAKAMESVTTATGAEGRTPSQEVADPDLLPFDDLRPKPPGPSDGSLWLDRVTGRVFCSRMGRPAPTLEKLSAADLARVTVKDGRATLSTTEGE